MTLGDLCYRGVGAVGKHGKPTKTSWDTLSYVLVQSHNVWMHINSVQEANRKFDKGVMPKMMIEERFDRIYIADVVDQIFAARDKTKSMKLIADHAWIWAKFRGEKPNSMTLFNTLYGEAPTDDAVIEESDIETTLAEKID
jgi:hypothetical protein